MPKKIPMPFIKWWLKLMLVGFLLSIATPFTMIAVDTNWPQYKTAMFYVDKAVGWYIHLLVWGGLISLWLYLEILVIRDGKFYLRESLVNIKRLWNGRGPNEYKFQDNAPTQGKEDSEKF